MAEDENKEQTLDQISRQKWPKKRGGRDAYPQEKIVNSSLSWKRVLMGLPNVNRISHQRGTIYQLKNLLGFREQQGSKEGIRNRTWTQREVKLEIRKKGPKGGYQDQTKGTCNQENGGRCQSSKVNPSDHKETSLQDPKCSLQESFESAVSSKVRNKMNRVEIDQTKKWMILFKGFIKSS